MFTAKLMIELVVPPNPTPPEAGWTVVVHLVARQTFAKSVLVRTPTDALDAVRGHLAAAFTFQACGTDADGVEAKGCEWMPDKGRWTAWK